MAEINKIAIECAINDAEGAALLLDLAITDLGQGDAWEILGLKPQTGRHAFVVTREQWTALNYASRLVWLAAREANVAFYGQEYLDELGVRK